ncbi:hypothetical protein ACOI22_11050 [Glaciecola sp. 2405UD65-10]|uniref:hypothetical protein n=1 Tax=Glaciecola sp. 2405UD65-10 TaxID=3397244 RepID=UPI003B5BE465
MTNPHRPLFKHIRNHTALFAELAQLRNNYAHSLGMQFDQFHKTPKLITKSGQRLSIEPERSIVLKNFSAARGLKTILSTRILGFHLVTNSDIGFRYPTAALAGLDAPYIKRFRSEYFHRVDENRDICRPTNLSYGIKSRGKSDNREEYEVWIPEQDVKLDPSPLFVNKYAEDLPEAVRTFAAEPPVVHGWMGVKRCAFEGIYYNKALFGDIAISVALSLDAYNIGAKPDLSMSSEVGSSICLGGAEVEWEVMGYFAPKQMHVEHDHIWSAINHTLEAISAPLEEAFAPDILTTDQSKTERILSAVASAGVSDAAIAEQNLKPWEFLQTMSEERKKNHDASRSVNFLGRLNRLFYHPDMPLPSLKELHFLAQQSLD